MPLQRQRNSIIDLYKFMFSIVVLLYHSNVVTSGFGIKLFRGGYIGVEFFFLVSGWLMASYIYEKDRERTPRGGGRAFITCKPSLGSDTWKFVFRKVKKIYPYYIVAFIIAFIVRHVVLKMNGSSSVGVLEHLFQSVWEIFLLQMSGLKWSFAVNGIAWYLSAMFLALLMIYPIVRKHFDSFAYVYGPVLSILLLAYLSLTYGSLNLTTSSETFVQPGLIRALAEITLGVTSFAVSKKLSELRLSGKVCGVFGIMEAACYIFVLAMAFIERDGHSDFILLAFLFAGVTISFSQQSILTKHIHLKFGNILAKIAMLIFLNQRCWMYLIPLFNLDSYFKNLLVFILFVCISSAITYWCGNKIVACIRKLIIK